MFADTSPPMMRLMLLGLLSLAFLSLNVGNLAHAANLEPWEVVEVRGVAEYQHNQSGWQPLAKGVVLRPGSRVQTKEGGHIVMKRPGDSVSVSPHSRFRIPIESGDSKGTHFFQSLGKLLFKVKTRPADPFRVNTPYLAAIIKGTTFKVSVNSRGAALGVRTGLVEVLSLETGNRVLVRPGHSAIIDAFDGGKIKMVSKAKPNKHSKSKVNGIAVAQLGGGLGGGGGDPAGYNGSGGGGGGGLEVDGIGGGGDWPVTASETVTAIEAVVTALAGGVSWLTGIFAASIAWGASWINIMAVKSPLAVLGVGAMLALMLGLLVTVVFVNFYRRFKWRRRVVE